MDVEEFAIRTHLWHLIVPVEPDPDDPRPPELYRKPEDRWDQNNVAGQHPEVAEHLELTLRRFVEAIGHDAHRLTAHAPRHRAVLPRLRRPGAVLPPVTVSRIRCQTRGRSVGRQGRETGQTSRFFGTDVGAEPPA